MWLAQGPVLQLISSKARIRSVFPPKLSLSMSNQSFYSHPLRSQVTETHLTLAYVKGTFIGTPTEDSKTGPRYLNDVTEMVLLAISQHLFPCVDLFFRQTLPKWWL